MKTRSVTIGMSVLLGALGMGLLPGCRGPKVEPKAAAEAPDAEECLARGDAAMVEGKELVAVEWYADAESNGSPIASVKMQVAMRALADACAEPSPAVIDNSICRAACAAKLTGRLAEAVERLLRRYAEERRFSIADVAELTPEDRHSFACELAAVGNDIGIGYMNSRKLIDLDDAWQGGVVHFAAAAGQEDLVKWLVGVCCADPWKKDDAGLTPSDWVDRELALKANPRAAALGRVKEYLASPVVVDLARERTANRGK